MTALSIPSANPSTSAPKRVTEATRIPMSVPSLKLAIPDLPGYHLHWFLGTNIPRAQRAGYEFVDFEEVSATQMGVANDPDDNGSTDMGTRISHFAGGLVEGTTEPQRLYLMKIRQEWRDKDVAAIEARNESVAQALRGGTITGPGAPEETAIDKGRKYVKTGQDLFYPKARKG